MATKAALEPSSLETHITSLMRASFGRLKVSSHKLSCNPSAKQQQSQFSRIHAASSSPGVGVDGVHATIAAAAEESVLFLAV